MSTESCPSFTALSEAFSAGPSAELRLHLEGCTACRAVLDDLARLKSAGQELPWRAPDPATESERAAALVERAMVARRAHDLGAARRRVVFVAASMAASLAAGYVLARQGTPAPGPAAPTLAFAPPSEPAVAAARTAEARAVVRGASGAQFHHARGHQGDERVELNDGRLTLEVAPIQAGERFRIVTEDGEVEMESGTVEVLADHGVLRSVVVLSGRAEVRPKDGAARAVTAGQRWGAEVAPSASPSVAPSAAPSVVPSSPSVAPSAAPSVVAAASPSVAPSAASSVVPAAPRSSVAVASPAAPRTVVAAAPSPSPELAPPPVTWVVSPSPSPTAAESPTPAIPAPTSVERSFKEAFDALRDGDFGVAAARFAEVEDKSDPLAEDASYWRAVALGRAGRTADARRAMERNLERWPSSARAPEVSAMLGWILLRQGERDSARAWLEKAQTRGNAAVKESAAKGLAELSR